MITKTTLSSLFDQFTFAIKFIFRYYNRHFEYGKYNCHIHHVKTRSTLVSGDNQVKEGKIIFT